MKWFIILWYMSTSIVGTSADAPAVSVLKMCTKCAKNPRVDQDDKATNRHCKECKTAATTAWQASKLEQQQGKGFVKGVQAMRDLLAEQFYNLDTGMFTGYEIAALIRQALGPVPEDDGKDKEKE